ncbi:hypothetical protein DWUX_589 [Desulfovibrio diazotrophicus]|nr:hypothetical protein DWUX_589 [Desulfovibrio diazotrophicus]VVU42724.1 hypothetical protein DWUX_70 [Desulfovibrio diazotrophicus]
MGGLPKFLEFISTQILIKAIEYKGTLGRILSDKEKGQNPLFARCFGLFCPSLD